MESFPESLTRKSIFLQSSGHPFLTQYIMHNLCVRGLVDATEKDVKKIANEFPNARFDFQDWLDGLGEISVSIYKTLSNTNKYLSQNEIREGLAFDVPLNWTQVLNALCYHGLVSRNSDNNYMVAGEMFRTWFREFTSSKMVVKYETSNIVDLAKKISYHFNNIEIKELCFMLGLDIENLAGLTKNDKAQELVLYFERHSQIPDLINICQEQRPSVNW
ncbi:MAG: hypothetical protein IPH82_26345 [Chloroflexi bacterium]|nr:hypothetical protein [Chloroflexota bacterium]